MKEPIILKTVIATQKEQFLIINNMISKQRINMGASSKMPLTPKNTNKLVSKISIQANQIQKEKNNSDQYCQSHRFFQRKKRNSLYLKLLFDQQLQLHKLFPQHSKSGYIALSHQLINSDTSRYDSKQNIPKIQKKGSERPKVNIFQEDIYNSPLPKKNQGSLFKKNSLKRQYLTPQCNSQQQNAKFPINKKHNIRSFYASPQKKGKQVEPLETSLQNIYNEELKNDNKYLCRATVQKYESRRKISIQQAGHQTKQFGNKKKMNTMYAFLPQKQAKTPTFLKKKNCKISLNDFLKIKVYSQSKYGEVFLACHKQTGYICIIKSICKETMKQENRLKAIISEIKIQSYLSHPNIVKLLGFFDDSQYVYLLIQYCPHGNLHELIKKEHPSVYEDSSSCIETKNQIFEKQNILEIVLDIFEGIKYMHDEGVLHRDLKPQNIVLSYGVHKICDFGWAVYASGETRRTFCGTPLYISPQLVSGKEYDEKIDVWGLGNICYQLAYGKVPFKMFQAADMMKIIAQDIDFDGHHCFSEQLMELMKKMLEKNTLKRLDMDKIMKSPIISKSLANRKKQYKI